MACCRADLVQLHTITRSTRVESLRNLLLVSTRRTPGCLVTALYITSKLCQSTHVSSSDGQRAAYNFDTPQTPDRYINVSYKPHGQHHTLRPGRRL